jgi:hypothetical protein
MVMKRAASVRSVNEMVTTMMKMMIPGVGLYLIHPPSVARKRLLASLQLSVSVSKYFMRNYARILDVYSVCENFETTPIFLSVPLISYIRRLTAFHHSSAFITCICN